MMDVAWRSLLDALVQVEGLMPGDSGVLSFGVAAGNSGIFVEDKQICWAAAPGLERRLRSLLKSGEPLEIILRRHTAESLVELCRNQQPTRWASRGGASYTPPFTLRPVDVLLDIGALAVPDDQVQARTNLRAAAPEGARGAAFHVDSVLELAIPIAEVGPGATVHGLRVLGRWALSVQQAARELGVTPAFTIATTATGTAMVVWWRGSILYTVACDDRSAVAAVTSHHLAGS